MGRRVEAALLHVAAQRAQARGAGELRAQLVPTAKNAPCRRFFETSGMTQENDVFRWNLSTPFPPPADVAIEVVGDSRARPR